MFEQQITSEMYLSASVQYRTEGKELRKMDFLTLYITKIQQESSGI
jgi:hypothetical protein